MGTGGLPWWPGGSAVALSMQGAWAPFLVRELDRTHPREDRGSGVV